VGKGVESRDPLFTFLHLGSRSLTLNSVIDFIELEESLFLQNYRSVLMYDRKTLIDNFLGKHFPYTSIININIYIYCILPLFKGIAFADLQ